VLQLIRYLELSGMHWLTGCTETGVGGAAVRCSIAQ